MAMTNYERVGKGLGLLQDGLLPFVEQEMKARYRSQWKDEAQQRLAQLSAWRGHGDLNLDADALLKIMWEFWRDVFRQTLGHAERSIVSELRTVRNDWAHQNPFSTDDAYRALDSMARLLTAVSAKEAREVERIKQDLLRLKYEEQARTQRRKKGTGPLQGSPIEGLRPWREIVTPHPDVASGRYQAAEFAANLATVYDDDTLAGHEYRDPEEFFARTFLTQGLQYLLKTAIQRVTSEGGDPVVELQTNFGGGKTHAMIALYHLFSGVAPAKLAGVETLLDEVEVKQLPKKVYRAVLVGTALSPGQPEEHLDGTKANTIWGEMAWQLGGEAGYNMVAQSDQQGTAPGSNVLRDLLIRYSPCVILIDEWVAFLRQLYHKTDIVSGSFDANLTFAQSLTEAVKQIPGALLVASLPASDIETGGEGGREALERLRNTFGRVESAWRPATAEEGFEIVRRRLFQPIRSPELFTARDNVIKAFSDAYRDQPQEFPNEAREAEYARRMTAAYPIHPELFDRLYEDWSALERFQRTRGVLRLMAAVIHTLWERNDGSLLILPATVPIDHPHVQSELTRYLEDNWLPVLEKDIDGSGSLALTLDRNNPNIGRYSAARRVGRTIFIGSAPTSKGRNPGIDERNIKLACTQPGESVATFGDALRRLTDNATYLYVDRTRYWFSTQPSVSRLAQDRAAQLELVDVWAELKKRLRLERDRGELAAVHTTPDDSGNVPDDDEARLVILQPEHAHLSRQDDSPAMAESRAILSHRGTAPRLYQNMLVFLAPDQTRLTDLEDAIRQYLAWESIHNERDTLNLDTFQRNQAKTKYQQTDEMINARIMETYIWLLVPYQSDPRNPNTLTIDATRLSGQGSLAERVSRKLINDESLITTYSAIRLKMALDRYNLWQDNDHLKLKQLWQYLARYPYLPRLCDRSVLVDAIRQGVTQDTWSDFFAFAGGWDGERGRYLSLVAGSSGSVMLDREAVLVRPTAAQRQLEADAAVVVPAVSQPEVNEGEDDGTIITPPISPPPVEPESKRMRFLWVCGVGYVSGGQRGRESGRGCHSASGISTGSKGVSTARD